MINLRGLVGLERDRRWRGRRLEGHIGRKVSPSGLRTVIYTSPRWWFSGRCSVMPTVVMISSAYLLRKKGAVSIFKFYPRVRELNPNG